MELGESTWKSRFVDTIAQGQKKSKENNIVWH